MSGKADMTSWMEKIIGWGEPNPCHDWYANRNGSQFRPGSVPWCNMAITWAAWHSGNHDAVCLGTDYAYTVYHAQKFRDNGQWTYGHSGIQSGDIVFYQWEGGSRSIGKIDHVEYVVRVTSNNIYTIGGNVDNAGKRMTRRRNGLITGYGRPRYEGGSSGDNSGGGGYNANRSTLSIQNIINDAGYTPRLVEDGVLGPKTEAGIRWYQRKIGAEPVDGEWGPITERAHQDYIKSDDDSSYEGESSIMEWYTATEGDELNVGGWNLIGFTNTTGEEEEGQRFHSVIVDRDKNFVMNVLVHVEVEGGILPEGPLYEICFGKVHRRKDNNEFTDPNLFPEQEGTKSKESFTFIETMWGSNDTDTYKDYDYIRLYIRPLLEGVRLTYAKAVSVRTKANR